MSGSSSTVGALAAQILALRSSQEDLRSLIVEVVREVLRVSQMQAEASTRFMALVESQQLTLQAYLGVGPGSSRNMTEEEEFRQWRLEQRDKENDARTADGT